MHRMVTATAREKFFPYRVEIRSARLLMRCVLQIRMILRSRGQNRAAMMVGPMYTARNSIPLAEAWPTLP